MAKRKSKFVRRDRPLVILSTRLDRRPVEQAFRAIAEKGNEYGWDLLDLRFTKGVIPDELVPRGAIIDALPTEPLARHLREIGCPAIRIGKLPHPQDDLLPAVISDSPAAGRLAAEHFAERGFHDVGYIGRKPWHDSRSLYEALRKKAVELGCKCHLLQFELKSEPQKDRYRHRSELLGEWLRKLPKPVGILNFADNEAAMVCTVCQNVGLSIPEEVAVLGIGNNELDCEMAPIELSSIDRADDETGLRAAELLKRLMDGEELPALPVIVPPRGIVARRSTDVLAVDDPAVVRAIRFMWDHLEQNIAVDDIVDEVGCARRKLERAFSRHLGHGINTELRRKRLERCCELLRNTDLRIADIAAETGFRSADNLHLSFRRHFGMTPRQYRIGPRAKDSQA